MSTNLLKQGPKSLEILSWRPLGHLKCLLLMCLHERPHARDTVNSDAADWLSILNIFRIISYNLFKITYVPPCLADKNHKQPHTWLTCDRKML